MTSSTLATLVVAASFSALFTGCAAQQPAALTLASASPAARQGSDRHVYRFDFVLTSTDAAATATSTAFSLNLQEFDKGEMMVGKNVPLTTAPAAPNRQDVGMRVIADFRMMGEQPLLAVNTELSAFEAPSAVRKVVAKGSALASEGKSSLVTTLAEGDKQYRLTVTPTLLH